MPILDLQRRLRQAGRIRIGQQVAVKGGKTRPAKLDTFRLTSQDENAIRAAAGMFGGTVNKWTDAPVGEQWEVITEASVMPVVVPPAATAFSQWYEAWSGGGCTRRCDGVTELISDSPCLCVNEDERTCKPHSRVNVILRDLPGVGVWRLDTSGYYAATELAGTIEVIMAAATRGQLLPAVLRLEQRQVKRPGEPTKKFAVPVLDIEMTPGALGLVVGTAAPTPELGPAPTAQGAWQPIQQPPIAELEPGQSDSDAIRDARKPAPKPRKNSAPPLPPTGLRPRGAPAEATPDPAPDTEPAADTLSDAQMKKLRALYNSVEVKGAASQKQITAVLLGVDRIGTHAALTVAQASHVIDQLVRIEEGSARFVLDDDGNVTGAVDESQPMGEPFPETDPELTEGEQP